MQSLHLFVFLLQIHFGDLNLPDKTSSSSSGISSGGSSVGAQKQSASEALEKFFPPRYMEPEAATGDTSVLESTLVEKWASLRGKSVHDCVRIYLTCTRKWQFFGAQLFEVQVSFFFYIAIFVFNDLITKTKNMIDFSPDTAEKILLSNFFWSIPPPFEHILLHIHYKMCSKGGGMDQKKFDSKNLSAVA